MTILSKKEHWDSNYNRNSNHSSNKWSPDNYDSIILFQIFKKVFIKYPPKNLLEIGCGNSKWLPFLGKNYSVVIAGIDYSNNGCLLAQEHLNAEGIEGRIFCQDFFEADPNIIGRYDFIYSLGFVEHFSNTQDVIYKASQFLKPGGIILTEVPNMQKSIHGLISWLYQPELYDMHEKISKTQMINAYQANGFEIIECEYAGLFSSTLIAWGKYPRHPRLSQKALPMVYLICSFIDKLLIKTKRFKGNRHFAPFLYIIGKK